VYRHGDRSPVVSFPADKKNTDKWQDGLGWLSQVKTIKVNFVSLYQS